MTIWYRRTRMSVSGQPDVIYAYDETGSLTGLVQGSSAVSFAYDAAGRRTTSVMPNGVRVDYGYDEASRLTGVSYTKDQTTIADLAYAYDLADNRIHASGSLSRTGLPQPIPATAYNAGNRLTQWGAQMLSYDANGNVGSDGLTTYTWDARNQLAAISGSRTALFQYDAIGRRIAATVGAGARAFLYDGLNVVQELEGSLPTANLLVHPDGLDEVLERTDVGGSRTPVLGGVGSVMGLVDATGAIQTAYTYDPFGHVAATGTPATNHSQFTGREADTPDLYYYRARYYSPGLGRFISEDPIGLDGGLNVYRYVGDNPISNGDPSGTAALNLTGPLYRTYSNGTDFYNACGNPQTTNGCTHFKFEVHCPCVGDGCGRYRMDVSVNAIIAVDANTGPSVVATAAEIFREENIHVADAVRVMAGALFNGEMLERVRWPWKWMCDHSRPN